MPPIVTAVILVGGMALVAAVYCSLGAGVRADATRREKRSGNPESTNWRIRHGRGYRDD